MLSYASLIVSPKKMVFEFLTHVLKTFPKLIMIASTNDATVRNLKLASAT